MEQCNNTPNSKAKVPFDPGWNDPPTISYNAQQTTGTNRPRNFLNKRVAFPLSGGSTNSSPQPPINLPPVPVNLPTNVPNIPPPIHSEEPSLNVVDIDSEKTLEDVKRILLKFLEDSAELGPKAIDIKRRIAVMEDMWASGKLDKSIHALMLDLACALRDEQPEKADELHRALMVDHVSAVGTWMPGVKHLIHHCIARSELMALDKE